VLSTLPSALTTNWRTVIVMQVINLRSILLVSSLLVAISSLFAQAPSESAASAAQTDSAMTNDDIVNMLKMGFSNDVIKAKIKQVSTVDFKLDVDELSKLKSAGVSQDVISEMLKRSTAKAEGPKEAQAPPTSMPRFVAGAGMPTLSDIGAVKLITKDHADIELRSSAGNMSTTYAFVTMLVYCNYSGLKADARIQDRRPTLLVKSGKSPKGRLYFVSANVDNRNGVRSVKMANGRLFGAKNIGAPDSDNQVEYDVVAEGTDMWRLTPAKDLRPGEYGLWDKMMEMYDFGIDP
jgi:hypothetical protein